MADQRCDVWLLTEVGRAVAIKDGVITRSSSMGRNKDYAAVWTATASVPLPQPVHEASAAARCQGLVVCSSILPWRSSASVWPDPGGTIGERTRATVDRLGAALLPHAGSVIWGGDWNNSLEGPNRSGTAEGLAAIDGMAELLGLQVPTARAPHVIEGISSIDHVAIPRDWRVDACRRLPASRLSDHDAYVVDTTC